MSFLKNIFPKKIKIGRKIFLYPALILLFLLLAVFFYNIYFWGTIFPNISLAGFSVSGKYPQVAADELDKKKDAPGGAVYNPRENNDRASLSLGQNHKRRNSGRQGGSRVRA